jgi:metal-responsive CopG/Arc/MetJ family transcriptional regulator
MQCFSISLDHKLAQAFDGRVNELDAAQRRTTLQQDHDDLLMSSLLGRPARHMP